MKKRLLASLFLSVVLLVFLPGRANAAGDVELSAANFPDANFRQVVAESFDKDRNGWLSDTEIKNGTELYCGSCSIRDLTGVCLLTELKKLYCSGNEIISLNVSGCSNLTYIDCASNQLTTINLRGCTNLDQLWCMGNRLTSLDVSMCPNLTWLDCRGNSLKTLNVSNCTKLAQLDCGDDSMYPGDNQLASLDVTDCLAMVTLICNGNQLNSLRVDSCSQLRSLQCNGNLLTKLDISKTKVSFEAYSAVGNQQNGQRITVLMTESQKQDFLEHCSDGSPYGWNERVNPVTSSSPLKITTQPVNASAAIGSSATFKVEASGSDLTYQWQYKSATATSWSNSGASSAKTATLSMAADSTRNGMQFRCIIKDAFGNSVISNAATMTISTTITAQPKNITLALGETGKFSVTATGAGLTYQWQYKSAGSSTWTNSGNSTAKTSTLSMSADSTRHGMQFRCVVKDANGKAVTSNAATMAIKAAITSQPKNITLAFGATGKFSISAVGNSLTYQWQYKPSGSSTWSNSSNSTAKTATLSMAADNTRNGMQFRCIVKDSFGNSATSNAATMTIITPGPTITTQPKSVTLALGATGKFTVAATGSGLTYQWQYKSAGSTTWNNSGSTSAKTATLSMTADSTRNGMQFRCIVKDSSGKSVTSSTATMTIKAAITSQPKSVTLAMGATGKFTVAATGSGLTYQWQYKSAGSSAWNNSGSSTAKTATLSMTADSTRNGMQFRCIVKDSAGNTATSSAATMTIKATITSQPKNVALAMGATGKFSVTAIGNGLTYQWQYKSATATTWTNSGSTTAKTATLSMTADSTRQGMQFRCIVKDNKGNSATSDTATMTIVPTITTQPKNVMLTLGETGKFTVVASGTGLTYQWQYKSATASSWSNSGSTTAKMATLEMKADSTRNGMQFRCVVKDSSGKTVTTNAATMTVVAKLEITAQPKSAVVFLGESGTFTVAATGTGLSYQWQYKAAGSTTWTNSSNSTAKTAVLNMTADSSRQGMQFRCVVVDAAGKKAVSNVATMTVAVKLLAITSQPKNVTLALGESGKFTVTAVGTGLTYQWQYKSAGSTTWKNSGNSTAATATLSMKADSTRNGMQFRCVVKDSAGNTAISGAATMIIK